MALSPPAFAAAPPLHSFRHGREYRDALIIRRPARYYHCRRNSANSSSNSNRGIFASALSPYLVRLQNGENLHEEAGAAITVLVDGLKDGSVNEIEGGALLSLMPPDKQSSRSIASVAGMLRSRMISPALPPIYSYDKGSANKRGDKRNRKPLLDIVGTGGDGLNTVNISTAAAIVAAACGCAVAKSGNRSASSKAGSADVLEALGVNLGAGEDALLQKCLLQAHICFLFARNHHPAIGSVAHIRKSLGTRTIFNILGPLVHPVPADNVVLGVYHPSLIVPMANALCKLGRTNNAMVVHCGGLDELAPVAPAKVAYITSGKTTGKVHTVDTNIAGISKCSIDDLVGGSAADNARTIQDIFSGDESYLRTPVADAIVLNAAAGCVVSGLDKTLEAAIMRARANIRNGNARITLEKWAAASNAAAVPR